MTARSVSSPGRIAVSVVVATRNRAERLRFLLDALEQQTLDRRAWEVVIVDDASDDGVTRKVLAHAEVSGLLDLRIIRLERRSGPATAREAGWRAARGDLVAFTDDDCEPTPSWLEAASAAARLDPGAFVQGRTLPNPREAASGGPFSRTIEVDRPDPHFHTCNIVYPRWLLEAVGGFDTAAFGTEPGGEDSDLAWRAIAAGARPTFSREALVFHAVCDLGPIGKLRVAARWTTPMRAFVIHPGLRRAGFVYGVFWKREHLWLLALIAGVLLPRRLRGLRAALMLPALRSAYGRAISSGSGPHLAPYFLLHDTVETFAVARAGIRYRRVML
jgi:glycosyltransferase involved in cell wall biosynthesis